LAVPAAEQGVTVTFPGTAASRVHFLPYLGTELLLEGQHADGRVKIVLPPLERGAVVWLE